MNKLHYCHCGKTISQKFKQCYKCKSKAEGLQAINAGLIKEGLMKPPEILTPSYDYAFEK